MAQVIVTVNGRRYEIACDDGQEAHLMRLGAYVDKRVSELIAAVGQVGDARLLVMVSLLLADELADIYSEMEKLKVTNKGAAARMDAEDALGDGLEALASRIEGIAARLEQA
ncbi:MAG: cell division protein ZapA [Magnetospirillum sp. WYHS-4]